MAGGNPQLSCFIHDDMNNSNIYDNAHHTFTSNQFSKLTNYDSQLGPNTHSDVDAQHSTASQVHRRQGEVERHQFRSTNVSPKKRSKVAHPNASSSKSKGKQKKNLTLLLEMPLDVLYEVCVRGAIFLQRSLLLHRYLVISTQGIWSTWLEHPRFSERRFYREMQQQYGEPSSTERAHPSILAGWASLLGPHCFLSTFVR